MESRPYIEETYSSLKIERRPAAREGELEEAAVTVTVTLRHRHQTGGGGSDPRDVMRSSISGCFISRSLQFVWHSCKVQYF
jgi:hypothetical protein